LVGAVEAHGYAIVSSDDRIADASGAMPPALRNDADWAHFQAELDLAQWVALGRLSHEAAPNPRRRRRLIASRSARGLEERADGWWWRPDAVAFPEVAARLMPRGGRLATPGGQGVFELFLGLGYAAFHLARAEAVTLPGGRGIFAGAESADARLRRADLTPAATRWLDAPARVSLTIYAPALVQ
jgi:hypothetical protein